MLDLHDLWCQAVNTALDVEDLLATHRLDLVREDVRAVRTLCGRPT